MIHKDKWKHETAANPLLYAERTHIAVFDDELPGQITLYRTDGERFTGCRSVVIDSGGHFRTVLEAWAAEAPLLDLRNDREVPLPVAVAAVITA